MSGLKASLNFSKQNNTSFKYQIDASNGFSTGSSSRIWGFDILKCEVVSVGSVAFKKSYENWLGINLPAIPALSVELTLMSVVRNEWKFFDGISLDLRSPTGF